MDELDLSKFAMPNYNPPSNSRSRSTSPYQQLIIIHHLLLYKGM
ncbi:hypothetical protein [Clostridioides difficile]|nr:hypothetical protein [Clostridioides difficile]